MSNKEEEFKAELEALMEKYDVDILDVDSYEVDHYVGTDYYFVSGVEDGDIHFHIKDLC